MNIFRLKNTLFTFLFLLLYACNAPRENPFDPNAANYKNKEHTIIQVNNLYPPYHGLENILVIEPNLRFSGKTAEDGTIVWQHEGLDSVHLFASGQGYFDGESLFTDIDKNATLTLFLNAKPYLQDTRFFSRYFSGKSYLEFQSRVIDPDMIADLKEVILFCPQYSFKDTLALNEVGSDYFTTWFSINEIDSNLSAGKVPELVFSLLVQNINGDSLWFEPFSIVRIIEHQIQPLSPASNDTVRGEIVFSWEEVTLDYPFTFSILLYQLPNFGLIKSYDNISGDSTRFTAVPLQNGRYMWVLELRDSANNISQSDGIIFVIDN